MYRITYYRDETRTLVDFKEFDSLDQCIGFMQEQPKDFIIEIKYYDNQTINLPNKSNTNR